MGGQANDADLQTCRFCPAVDLSILNGPEHIRHVSAHILHDVRVKDAETPCGLCLSSSAGCTIKLSKGSIDITRSRCPMLRTFNIRMASEFKRTSPCTNHPLECPLCDPGAPAIWKYNLRAHLSSAHASANVELYKGLYEITSDESTLMKAALLLKTRTTAKKRKLKQNVLVSDAYSTRGLFQ